MAPSPTDIDTNPSNPALDLDPNPHPSPSRALIGHPPNHWLHTPTPPTFDLTRPAGPSFPPPSPHATLSLSTTTSTIILSPPTTALLIIDMQNFFLSPILGRPPSSAGNLAATHLLRTAIPAARAAGIRIVWLNWGLTAAEIAHMPASTLRAFGFETAESDPHGVNQAAVEAAGRRKREGGEEGKAARVYKGLGSEMGDVRLEDGAVVDAGRLLVRHTWNASLPPALLAAYEEGAALARRPDVWVHKNRMSGLWGAGTACTEFLETQGITTLLFSGVNTDQCVSGSLQDAFSRGYDCVLLRDGCGTTSPKAATEGIEFNCARTWGFVADCEGLKRGVEEMLEARKGK